MISVGVATVAGLAAVLIGPSGLGEIPVFLAASRIAVPIDRGWGRVFVVVDTLAVAAVVGYVSHSLVGLLAGLGIPVLAQRAVERRELIASRDEAQALLAEVQAGREAEAQAAALQERGRIARDLHDVLAHSLAGLSVQLQATRAIAARENVDPAVLEPLDKAAALARDGLTEARAVVTALRDPVGLGIGETRHAGRSAPRRGQSCTSPAPSSPSPRRPATPSTARCRRRSPTPPATRPGPRSTVRLDYAAAVSPCASRIPARRPVAARWPRRVPGSAWPGWTSGSVRSAARSPPVRVPDGGWRVEVRVPVTAGSTA